MPISKLKLLKRNIVISNKNRKRKKNPTTQSLLSISRLNYFQNIVQNEVMNCVDKQNNPFPISEWEVQAQDADFKDGNFLKDESSTGK